MTKQGHDALHTIPLTDGNRSTDGVVMRRADADARILVTKDIDFADSHLLRGTPRRLLLVSSGNVTNAALMALFEKHFTAIAVALEEAAFVEVSVEGIAVHDGRAG